MRNDATPKVIPSIPSFSAAMAMTVRMQLPGAVATRSVGENELPSP